MAVRQLNPTDISFTKVADCFVAELRNGKSPSIQSFVLAFPHLEKAIRANFPTLLVLEKNVAKKTDPIEKPVDKVLGNCLVQEEIGRGAMGVVYRGYQAELDRVVAIKTIPLDEMASFGVVQRFELERRAMAKLDHANIVPVYEYGYSEDHAFLVMKFIDGHSLDKILCPEAQYRLKVLLAELQSDWRAFAELGMKVASGLQHAHEQGLVHRDIKPANLLFDKSRKIWITDFGLAKAFDHNRSLSRTGDAIGTPRYMAPEQLRGLCDCRSDVYSLGITLYELATGSRAWSDSSLEALTLHRDKLKLNSILDENPEIPDGLAKIIMKACSFAPEDRYQTAKELQYVLERFASGVSPSDRRRRRREPDDVYRKRSKRTATMLVASAIALLVFSVVFSIAFRRQSSDLQAQIPTPKILPSSENFIESLADPKTGDLGHALTKLVKDSLENSSSQLRLEEGEKTEILSTTEELLKRIKNREISGAPLSSFLDGYRESSLPAGTQIMSLVRFVERSKFKPREVEMAYETLRGFAKLVVNRQIPEQEAYSMIANLTGGKVLSAAEMAQFNVSDEKLFQWLMSVRNRISRAPAQALQGKMNIAAELERVMRSPPKGDR